MIEFHSTAVSAYTEDDIHIIGLGNDDEAPDAYIILTRYDDPGYPDEPRDEMIGIDTHASTHEVSAAISAVSLSRTSLEIAIRAEKATDVGAARLRTTFEIDDKTFAELATYLNKICADAAIVLSQTSNH